MKSYITTYYIANCDYFRQHIEYPYIFLQVAIAFCIRQAQPVFILRPR